VEERTINLGVTKMLTVGLGPCLSILSISKSTAAIPTSRNCGWIVVSGTSYFWPIALSSNPTTEKSPGIFIPSDLAMVIALIAHTSL
jgi:hypothetical protein